MRDDEQQELFQLLSALCEGNLSNEQGTKLATLLRESPDARVAYVRYINIHASFERSAAVAAVAADFETRLRSHGVELTEDEEVPSVPVQHRSGWRRLHSPIRPYLAAAVMLLIGVTSWFAWRDNTPIQDLGPIVAQVLEDGGCKWERALLKPDLHAGQQMTLTSGFARLRFDDQTVALIEAPTSLEIISESALRLHSGTVVLRANGPKKDFTVLAANSSVIDRGTSFGVHSDRQGVEIEVFEGAVEVLPDNEVNKSQVLGLGAAARVSSKHGQTDIAMIAGDEGRFTDLLQMLWKDMHSVGASSRNNLGSDSLTDEDYPSADFPLDAKVTDVDQFHGAQSGHGWVTPWLASGNLIGEVATAPDGLNGPEDPFLRLHFFQSYLRTIAREYGSTASFDPYQPHVITWTWRFDGEDEDFGGQFRDRVAFYGNSYFRRNSSADVTWFIGWIGSPEDNEKAQNSIRRRWFVFDGAKGTKFNKTNMVDTELELRRGVVYRFAVVLYPETRQYDAIIRDDQQTFVRRGLSFRNPSSGPGNVLHFSVGNARQDGDASFSIDSLRVLPLKNDLFPENNDAATPVFDDKP